MEVGAVEAPNDSEEENYASDYDSRSGYREVSLSGSRCRCARQCGLPPTVEAPLCVVVLPEAAAVPGRHAAILVGAFAVFHGHAHGAELPVGADAIAYSMGFVVATGMLHASGIAFGGLSHWPTGRVAVRVVGAVIALIGVAYLVRSI
jgi:hypothetical protein